MASRFATCSQFAAALAAALGSHPGAPSMWLPPAAVDMAVKPSFRYIHEPSRAGEDAFASLGNDGMMAELESRIQHSRGGTLRLYGHCRSSFRLAIMICALR